MRIAIGIAMLFWTVFILPALIFYNGSNNLPYFQLPTLSGGIVFIILFYSLPLALVCLIARQFFHQKPE